METLPDRFRYAMALRGMTAKDLVAKKVMSKASVYLWLNGTSQRDKIREVTVDKVCAALRVRRNWLMNGVMPIEDEGPSTYMEDLERLSCTVNDTTAIILTVCRFLADSIPSAALALSERVRAETLVESGRLSELVAMVLERGHEAVAPFDTFPQGKKTLSHP